MGHLIVWSKTFDKYKNEPHDYDKIIVFLRSNFAVK